MLWTVELCSYLFGAFAAVVIIGFVLTASRRAWAAHATAIIVIVTAVADIAVIARAAIAVIFAFQSRFLLAGLAALLRPIVLWAAIAVVFAF